MDLLDFLGNAAGGGMGGTDELQARMIAQLGGDPAAMQHQARMAALRQMGAAMLAGSAPSTEHKSFASILGQGMLSGQQAASAAQGQDVNRLYMLENMRRAQAADAEAQRKTNAATALSAQFQNPDFIKTLPTSLQQYANILANLPPEQSTSLILGQQRQDAADKKADLAARKPQIHFNPWGGAEAVTADDTAPGGFRFSALGGPQSAPPPHYDPGELSKSINALRSLGYSEDAIKDLAGEKFTGAHHDDARTKAAATATAKRVAEIDGKESQLQNLLDNADHIEAGVTSGAFSTGGWAQRHYDSMAPNALRSDNVNTFDALTNQLALDAQQAMKNQRGSNLIQQLILKTKPGVGNSDKTNLDVVRNIREPIAAELARIRAERDRYQNGESILSPQGGSAGAAAPAGVAPGSAGVMPGGGQVAPGAAQTSTTQPGAPSLQVLIAQANAALKRGVPQAQIDAKFHELAAKYGYVNP